MTQMLMMITLMLVKLSTAVMNGFTDDAVATTGAICDHVESEIDAIKVIERNVTRGEWIQDDSDLDDDDHFATTAAITERLDPFFEEMHLVTSTMETAGKMWFENDEVTAWVWDQDNRTWVSSGMSGPPGPVGPIGTYQTIVSDDPPTRRLDNTELMNGDVWFNSNRAELFVWYDDGNPEGNRGKQWVQALAGMGATGEPGEPGEDGETGGFGPPGHVIVSDTPPTEYPALEGNEARELISGDLWFDSFYVMLYVYYEDDAGPGQWVAVSKTVHRDLR